MARQQPIYLDHHASTPVDDAVADAMDACLRTSYANPHSIHKPGLEANGIVEKARRNVAALVGAEVGSEIVFTSGATESSAMALLGLAEHGRRSGRDTVIVTSIEHPAVLQNARFLKAAGFKVKDRPK